MTKVIIMHYEPNDDSYVYEVERYFDNKDYGYNYCIRFTNSSLYFDGIDLENDTLYDRYISGNDEFICLIECEMNCYEHDWDSIEDRYN